MFATFFVLSPASAATTERSVYYSYDVAGRQLSAKFDSATGGTHGEGIANSYDGFGDLVSSQVSIWDPATSTQFTKTLTSAYDGAGRRTQVTHPDNQAFTYAYDALSRLSGVYQGVGTSAPLDTFAYGNNGLVASRAETGGSSVGYSWDDIGRLLTQGDAFAGGTGNVNWTLSYSPASQIGSETRDNNSYAWTGAVNVNRPYAVNGLNQYTSAGSASFTYDANGNLITDGTWTYTYDVENRLIKAVTGSTTVNLTYDPLGRLFQVDKGSTATTTKFVYDGDAEVLEYNSSGAVTNRYVHGSNLAADDPLIWYAGSTLGTLRYLHADHLGSIASIASSTGANYAIDTYDEYGINGSANNTSERFGYTGQAYIPELGLYYYKARFYSPSLGRFLQTDPIGYKDQINLYEYVGDDPVDDEDPTGLADEGAAGSDAAALANTCSRVGSTGCSGTYPGSTSGNSLSAQRGGQQRSSQVSHTGMNGLPQDGPPVTNYPALDDTMIGLTDANDTQMVMAGQMSEQELMDRREARAEGALTGLAILDGAVLVRGAATAIGRVVSVEGAGRAAQYGTGRIGQVRFGGGRLILRLDRPPRTGGYYHLNVESHTFGFNWHIPINPLHWIGF